MITAGCTADPFGVLLPCSPFFAQAQARAGPPPRTGALTVCRPRQVVVGCGPQCAWGPAVRTRPLVEGGSSPLAGEVGRGVPIGGSQLPRPSDVVSRPPPRPSPQGGGSIFAGHDAGGQRQQER